MPGQRISLTVRLLDGRRVALSIEEKIVKYPFLKASRDFLSTYPLNDDVFQAVREPILSQARYRISLALRNPDIDIQNVRVFDYLTYRRRTNDLTAREELVEFYSFFVAMLAAKNEPFLRAALSKTESFRAKKFFLKETPEEMVSILGEAVGIQLTRVRDQTFVCPVMQYLPVATNYEMTRDPRWSLVNMRVNSGLVYFSLNDIQDFFASLVEGLMLSGMRALKTASVQPFIHSLVEEFRTQIPRPPVARQRQYDYIQRLLAHPITDGRHRVIWLILAPYFTTIKGLDESAATDAVLSYIGDTKYRQFVRSNVRRAIRSGLFPPTEDSLRKKHPDVFGLMPKEVFESKATIRK